MDSPPNPHQDAVFRAAPFTPGCLMVLGLIASIGGLLIVVQFPEASLAIKVTGAIVLFFGWCHRKNTAFVLGEDSIRGWDLFGRKVLDEPWSAIESLEIRTSDSGHETLILSNGRREISLPNDLERPEALRKLIEQKLIEGGAQKRDLPPRDGARTLVSRP